MNKFISSRFSKLADFCARCGFSIIWWLKLNRQNNWTEQSIWNPFFFYCMRVNARTRALSFATLRFTFAFSLAIRKSIIVFTYRCRFAFVVDDDEKENCQLYRQTGNKIRCVNNEPHHRKTQKKKKKKVHMKMYSKSIQCIDQDDCNFTQPTVKTIIACALRSQRLWSHIHTHEGKKITIYVNIALWALFHSYSGL